MKATTSFPAQLERYLDKLFKSFAKAFIALLVVVQLFLRFAHHFSFVELPEDIKKRAFIKAPIICLVLYLSRRSIDTYPVVKQYLVFLFSLVSLVILLDNMLNTSHVRRIIYVALIMQMENLLMRFT